MNVRCDGRGEGEEGRRGGREEGWLPWSLPLFVLRSGGAAVEVDKCVMQWIQPFYRCLINIILHPRGDM